MGASSRPVRLETCQNPGRAYGRLMAAACVPGATRILPSTQPRTVTPGIVRQVCAGPVSLQPPGRWYGRRMAAVCAPGATKDLLSPQSRTVTPGIVRQACAGRNFANPGHWCGRQKAAVCVPGGYQELALS